MCFNLFGPLVHDLALATQLFRAVPELEVERVLAVKLEFAPLPAEEYLADGTSFDAYVEYAHRDGSRAFVGIETKLTDGFSRKVCDTPAYRRWMQGPRAPWRPEAASRVANVDHNQLWRDHLLAMAMRDHSTKRYEHGALMLVRHPQDNSGAAIARGYRQLLGQGDTSFIDAPMDQLVGRWRAALGSDERGAWLSSFSQRYLALADSQRGSGVTPGGYEALRALDFIGIGVAGIAPARPLPGVTVAPERAVGKESAASQASLLRRSKAPAQTLNS